MKRAGCGMDARLSATSAHFRRESTPPLSRLSGRRDGPGTEPAVKRLLVVPKYYFHVRNDINADDDVGVELSDEAAARAHAQEGARDLICHSIREHSRVNLDHHINVTDKTGIVLFPVTFRECFTLIGR